MTKYNMPEVRKIVLDDRSVAQFLDGREPYRDVLAYSCTHIWVVPICQYILTTKQILTTEQLS